MRSVLGLAAGAFAVAVVVLFALETWAWQARQPDVPRWWRFRRDRMFHANLYTDEGNRRRRLAVAWFAFTVALAVVTWVAVLGRSS